MTINWKEFFESDEPVGDEHDDAAHRWCECALHELRPDLIEHSDQFGRLSSVIPECPAELRELGHEFADAAEDRDKPCMQAIYEQIRDWKPQEPE